MKKLLYILLGIGIAFAGTVYAINVTVPSAPTNGYALVSTSTGAWISTSTDPFHVGSIYATSSTATSVFNGNVTINGTCIGCGSGGGSGGGTFSTTTSTVSGEFINYPNNNTDIVTVGGTSTSTAIVFFDPNIQSYRIGSSNTASTTLMGNLFLPTVGQGWLYGGTNGKVGVSSTSTLASELVGGSSNQIQYNSGSGTFTGDAGITITGHNKISSPNFAASTGITTPQITDATAGDFIVLSGTDLSLTPNVGAFIKFGNATNGKFTLFDNSQYTTDQTIRFPDETGTTTLGSAFTSGNCLQATDANTIGTTGSPCGGGSGTITTVGDVTSGAAFDGTQGTTLTSLTTTGNNFNILSGQPTGATDNGNNINIIASDGGATSGAGGQILLLGGAGEGGDSDGGNVSIVGGASSGAGIPGRILIDSQGGTLSFSSNDSFNANLDTSVLTLDRTFFFPDETGTFALATSSVPATAGNCAQWLTVTTLGDSGSPCGSGGGTSAFEIATTSDIAQSGYAYFTKTSGRTTLGSVSTSTIANFILPFTSYGASTSTVIGFTNGLFTNASTTLTSVKIPSLSAGFAGIGGLGQVYSFATSSIKGSQINNDSGWTSNTGTVTSVVAGAGFQNQGLNITTSGTLVGAIATSANPTLGQLTYWTGVGSASLPATVGSVATGTVSAGSSAITVTAGRSAIGGALAIDCATSGSGQNGCLSSTDWSTFNNKQASLVGTFPISSVITSNTSGTLIATGTQLTVGNLLATTSASSVFNGRLGLSTTTPFGNLSIHASAQTNPYFVIGSSTATSFSISPITDSGSASLTVSTTTAGCASFGSTGILYSTGSACGSGVGGGASQWATTTNLVSIYPSGGATTGVIIGGSATTTSTNLQVLGTTTSNSLAVGSTAIGSNVLKVSPLTGLVTSNSESVGGVVNENYGTTDVLNHVIYSNNTGSQRVFSIISDDATYSGNTLHIRNDGTDSALNILCQPTGKGCLKIGSEGAGDANASLISLDASLSSFLGQTMFIKCGTSATCWNLRDANNSQVFTVNSNGYSGWGTTTPAWQVQIATSSKPQLALSGASGDVPWTFRSVGGNLYIATASPTTYATTSTAALTLNSSGASGLFVGTTTNSALTNGGIAFTGNMYASGLTNSNTGDYVCFNTTTDEIEQSATACSLSSIRFKQNVRDEPYGLNEILSLHPVLYDLKPQYGTAKNQPGFIAEEAVKVVPDLVPIGTDGLPNNFDYPKLTVVLTNAIQQFYKEFQDLVARISGLEAKVNNQQQQIDYLQAEIDALKK